MLSSVRVIVHSEEFLGFDTNEPTSRSGGKPIAVQQIRKVKGYKAFVMIGDGATDLEPSSLFFLLISRISPGIEELVKKLKARNTEGVCWNSQFGIQRLSAETGAASIYCGFWF
ncbi:hypothetical protein PVK06_039783 [Gossypium arboreum]|uniref:phosphoserine phosphatase n=1 Tax=Gossypium arboreum TaxID=29729 RepID=A0ABR0N5W2_GOSAR|nr:hypothetical protein PVK06_039783 [Gossypium arboreum]